MNPKIGIICAGDIEVEPFLHHISNCIISEKAMLKFYEGAINGINVVALFCGICKVNAAIATQILIDSYHVNIVINTGTAGGMSDTLDIFDTVISTEAAYHDVDDNILTEFHPWAKSVYFPADNKLLEYSKKAVDNLEYKVFFGRMVTGEAFIEDSGRKVINEKYQPLSVDMETASIAHVCYVNKIPFIAIRTITDTATHSGAEHFEANCKQASSIAKDITLALLNEIKSN